MTADICLFRPKKSTPVLTLSAAVLSSRSAKHNTLPHPSIHSAMVTLTHPHTNQALQACETHNTQTAHQDRLSTYQTSTASTCTLRTTLTCSPNSNLALLGQTQTKTSRPQALPSTTAAKWTSQEAIAPTTCPLQQPYPPIPAAAPRPIPPTPPANKQSTTYRTAHLRNQASPTSKLTTPRTSRSTPPPSLLTLHHLPLPAASKCSATHSARVAPLATRRSIMVS